MSKPRSSVNERVARLRQLIDEAHSGRGSGSVGAESGVSTAEELRKLADRTEGALAKEEFEAAKARILQA
jgi:protein-arginine kinase activator protein McsA